ncbi:hypothetical protein C8R45DRAFT_943184 [Mycena sanguinolenta]|nr:hypothetical protein C8R45DRAFT_943184 [Mycena sanguinolenta]
MALRISLLLALHPCPSLDCHSDFEELYVDFDSPVEMVNYLRWPLVVRFCKEYLRPLRDVAMAIRDRFRFQDPMAQDGPWVREQMCRYVAIVSYISNCAEGGFSSLHEFRPVLPSVNSMWWMLRLVCKFGFDGDDIDFRREERLRLLLVVYQHRLKTGVMRTSRVSHRDRTENMDARFPPPRSTEELSSIPEALKLVLPAFFAWMPDLDDFHKRCDPVLDYFVLVAGPYAHLLNKAFPSMVLFPSDLPSESREYLLPHVFNFLRFLNLAFVLALERVLLDRTNTRIPPQAICTLTLMQKFHCLLGEPSYDNITGYEPEMLDRIVRMLSIARLARSTSADPIDIPYEPMLGYLPCVPSWTSSRITSLRIEEVGDPWAPERYWLWERKYVASRATKDLGDAIAGLVGPQWYPDEGR